VRRFWSCKKLSIVLFVCTLYVQCTQYSTDSVPRTHTEPHRPCRRQETNHAKPLSHHSFHFTEERTRLQLFSEDRNRIWNTLLLSFFVSYPQTYTKMSKWFRSEPMEYISLIVNQDAAHDTLADLGSLGVVQFTDVSYE